MASCIPVLLLCALTHVSGNVLPGGLPLHLGRGFHKVPPPPPPPPRASTIHRPHTHYFTQKLDHFDKSNNATWTQRYFQNSLFFVDGGPGPVFLYIEGESPASEKWIENGGSLIADSARENGALLLTLEHRFYGESQPTSDWSTDNLKFLSSEQALEDLANFQREFSKTNGLEDAKWIVFGGSYAGNLAAWYRLKHPELCHGAVASSAPVLAELDFKEYLVVVGEGMKAITEGCYEGVQQAIDDLTKEIEDPNNWSNIIDTLNLCPFFNFSNADDVDLLLDLVAGYFSGEVQYGNNYTLKAACRTYTDPELGSLEKIAQTIAIYTGRLPCLKVSYSDMIDDYRETTINYNDAYRQWMYQTCAEFGYYQTTDDKHQPFGHDISLELYIKDCELIFDESFDEEFIGGRVDNTNKYYGGRDMNTTRIIFPNGSWDPWHILSVTEDLNPEAKLLLIPGGSHCEDMYAPNTKDSSDLAAAKHTILESVKTWLSED